MSRNFLIFFISSILIVLFIVFIIINKNGDKIIENNKIVSENNNTKAQSAFDENTSLYYIKDEKTGEILGASQDETDLKFYEENPDYNPNPLQKRSTNIEDYYSYSD